MIFFLVLRSWLLLHDIRDHGRSGEIAVIGPYAPIIHQNTGQCKFCFPKRRKYCILAGQDDIGSSMEEPNVNDYDIEETQRRVRRERRRQELHRRQRRKARQRKLLVLSCAGICMILLLAAGFRLIIGKADPEENTAKLLPSREYTEKETLPDTGTEAMTEQNEPLEEDRAEEEESKPDSESEKKTELPFASGYTAEATENTAEVDEESALSAHALLIYLDNSTIVAQRGVYDRINPASMTKILTLLVAAEHITDLEDTFTITRSITDYSYRNDCSAAGFDEGETVTVKDLMYGTILPSGADAAAGLAYYVSDSLEGFMELINEKISELGLSDTAHFTNCVGLYDENHYCTIYDMAIMLKAAVENDLCREVLSAHIYTTSSTEQHPEGIELSNWFLRRIEDKETNGEVVCAKTGFVAQSGNCAASYAVSGNGKHYICVTADTYSSWRCIYDHVGIYQRYTE